MLCLSYIYMYYLTCTLMKRIVGVLAAWVNAPMLLEGSRLAVADVQSCRGRRPSQVQSGRLGAREKSESKIRAGVGSTVAASHVGNVVKLLVAAGPHCQLFQVQWKDARICRHVCSCRGVGGCKLV